MNIAVVPYHDKLLKDKLFDIEDKALNRDNILNVYEQIRRELREKGHECRTIDMYSNLKEVDYVLFFSLSYKYIVKCLKHNMEDRLIYFAWEPEVVDRNHSKQGIAQLKRYFKYVMTWNDEWVDNIRVFKINIPYYFLKHRGEKAFKDKCLLTNISGYKFSSHPKELYSERLKVINYFEKKGSCEFAFYGLGWPKERFHCYKGAAQSKFEVYHNFKFALCLENMKNIRGYITEKIFDCFMSGIVPIYYGAEDILDHIPQECFIDYSRFNSIEELDIYLNKISEDEYNQFIQAIDTYLGSKQVCEFTSKSFYEAVNVLWNKDKDEQFKVSFMSKVILMVRKLNLFIKTYIKKLLRLNKKQ